MTAIGPHGQVDKLYGTVLVYISPRKGKCFEEVLKREIACSSEGIWSVFVTFLQNLTT
jgi:hypothetical protein